NLAPADRAGSREQRAIATEHDGQVAPFGNFRPREAVAPASVDSRLLVIADANSTRFQPFDQLGRKLSRHCYAGLRKDADRPNVGYTTGIPCSLPPPE